MKFGRDPVDSDDASGAVQNVEDDTDETPYCFSFEQDDYDDDPEVEEDE